MSPALSLGVCSLAPAVSAEMKISMQVKGGKGKKCSSAEGLCVFNMLTDRTAVCAVHDGEGAVILGCHIFSKKCCSPQAARIDPTTE